MYSPTGIDLYFSEDEETPSISKRHQVQVPQETPTSKEIQQQRELLHVKALAGDVQHVSDVLLNNSDIVRHDGYNILHAACCGLQLKVIQEVLNNHNYLLQGIESEQKRTPLHCALGAAFDKEELEEDGIVLATSLLPQIVSLLVSESNEEVFIHQDLFGRTPLHIAATICNFDIAVAVLAATPPSAFSLRNHTGDTTLHIASRNDLKETKFIDLLLLKYLPISHLRTAVAPSLPIWNRLFHKKNKKDTQNLLTSLSSTRVPRVANPPNLETIACSSSKQNPLKDMSLVGDDKSDIIITPSGNHVDMLIVTSECDDTQVDVICESNDVTPLKHSNRPKHSPMMCSPDFDFTPLRNSPSRVVSNPIKEYSEPLTPLGTSPQKVVVEGALNNSKQQQQEFLINNTSPEVEWLLRISNNGNEPPIHPKVARELLLKTSHRLVAKLLLTSESVESNLESNPPLTSFKIPLIEQDIEDILTSKGTTWIDVLDMMVTLIQVRYRFAAIQTTFAGVLVVGDEITDYLVTILLFINGKYSWAIISTLILIVSQLTLIALLTRMGKSEKYKHAFQWVPNRNTRLFPVLFVARVFLTATTNLWKVTDLTKTRSLQGLTIALAFLEAMTESIPQAVLQFFLYRSKQRDDNNNNDDTQFYLLVVSLSISAISILKAIVTYIYFKCFNRTNILGIIRPLSDKL